MPETGSEPPQSTVRRWLYQPLESGGRDGSGAALGGVASYRNESAGGAAALPAWSVHWPPELALPSSGPLYVSGAVQESIPEVASVPLQPIETGWLYQPSWSGGRAAVTVTVGGVPSYRSPNALVLLFPAASVHVPGAEAFAPSGPAYVPDEQDTPPDVASVPCQSTRTGCRYQPSWSGARSAVGAESAGGVASYFTT